MFNVLLINFDRVLFNTSLFLKDIKKNTKKLGISDEVFNKTYHELKKENQGYNLFLHLMKISANYNINLELAKKDVYCIMDNITQYLYSDSIEFLENIRKQYSFLVLFSSGDSIFQMSKFKGCNMVDYFDDIFVAKDENERFNAISYKYSDYLNNLSIIDANPDFLALVKEKWPKVNLFRIIREDNKKFNNINFAYATNLENLLAIK